MQRKRQKRLVGSEIAYLDPNDCGSTAGYALSWSRYGKLDGCVDLSDCNRHIQWYFYGNNKNTIAKIDKAISILQNFKHYLASAKRQK